ncbi:amidohydrolase [Thermomonospora umbrina]|uniref:Amidohydrolase 3 domain-containing protein n=1 Tax=Thermomonospora umbrina TaxID=111806 RepID=A0A3D9SI59_9ACTN|nr:amidohydrolase [Thermomonospora umbrina]REE95608.1 hypothetical protein DFJ69_1005 [Thermomonospora umbrina]
MNDQPALNGRAGINGRCTLNARERPVGRTRSSRQADLIVRGRILTLDPFRPLAEALAVRAGRIVAIGAVDDVRDVHGPTTRLVDAGDGCVLPGFVEAHGHFVNDALERTGALVGLRPVRLPEAGRAVEAIRRAVAERGAEGACLYGWDARLRERLPVPTLAWLDELAPDAPLIILYDSGHSAYFNSATMRRAGLSRDAPDPAGGHFGRTPDGHLDGTAYEPAAVARVTAHLTGSVTLPLFAEALAAQGSRVNAAGITTISEMSFNPAHRPRLTEARGMGALTARLRLYEIAGPSLGSGVAPGMGDDLLRQIGVKLWVDGSAWGDDTAATRPNHTHDELDEIFQAYHDAGWQLACHADGDSAIGLVLNVWEELLDGRAPAIGPPRLRMEHVGSMRPDQFDLAHALGVSCSLSPDHPNYWSEVLSDDLFGADAGERWTPEGSALRSGMRVSLHGESPAAPVEPLRAMAVAADRLARHRGLTGRDARIGVAQALQAQTIDAAWQLHADGVTGSLEPGKYADLVILSADPHDVPPAEIADLTVRATFLAGRQVHGEAF